MTAAVPNWGPMLCPRNRYGLASPICIPSSWYRLLQFDTHRSTSTPSTHRPSRLARADPPDAPSTNPRASWAVSGVLASQVCLEMQLAQCINCCRSHSLAELEDLLIPRCIDMGAGGTAAVACSSQSCRCFRSCYLPTCAHCTPVGKMKRKTTPFGINLMRSHVLSHRVAQGCTPVTAVGQSS